MATDNLWGELPAADTSVSPARILKEQGSQLEAMTKGAIVGEVTNEGAQKGKSRWRFDLLVPALNNYQHFVLAIVYPTVELYSCRVESPYLAEEFGGVATHPAENEEQFKLLLRSAFQSSGLKKVIAALLRQVNEATG